MSDMNVKAAATPAAYTPPAPAEQPTAAATAQAPNAPAATLKLSDGVKSALAVYNQYKAQSQGNSSSPLSGQIIGYGSISARRTAVTTTLADGSKSSRFEMSYESTFINFSSGQVTCTTSRSSAGFFADGNGGITHYQKSLTTCVTFNANDYQPGQLGDTIDRLTACYTAQKGYVQHTTAQGPEQAKQLEDLANLYQTGRDAACNSFAGMLNSLFKQTSKFDQQIQNDMNRLFDETLEQYQSQADKLSKEDWLTNSLNDLVDKLQKMTATSREEKPQHNLLLASLDYTAVSISAYHASIRQAGQSGGSEARQALQFSMISLKVEALSAHRVIGGSLGDLLKQAGKDAQDKLLEAMDQRLTDKRQQDKNKEKFPPADRNMFNSVYNQVMASFDAHHNAISALQDGAKAAKSLLEAAVKQTPAQRWTAELHPRGYWPNFNQPNQSGGIHSYAAEWRSFSLEISRYQRVSRG